MIEQQQPNTLEGNKATYYPAGTNDHNLLQVQPSVAANRSSSSLGDLNLELYSPGQETNEGVNTGRAKIGYTTPSCNSL